MDFTACVLSIFTCTAAQQLLPLIPVECDEGQSFGELETSAISLPQEEMNFFPDLLTKSLTAIRKAVHFPARQTRPETVLLVGEDL